MMKQAQKPGFANKIKNLLGGTKCQRLNKIRKEKSWQQK